MNPQVISQNAGKKLSIAGSAWIDAEDPATGSQRNAAPPKPEK